MDYTGDDVFFLCLIVGIICFVGCLFLEEIGLGNADNRDFINNLCIERGYKSGETHCQNENCTLICNGMPIEVK